MKFLSLTSLVISAFALLSSCGSEHVSKEPHPCIAAYSSGSVSVNSPFVVEFADGVKFIEEPTIGAEVAAGVIKISPSVKGKAVWRDSKTIVFTPNETLKAGKEYKIAVYFKKIIELKAKQEPKFVFAISTRAPYFGVMTSGLQVYSDYDQSVYSLSGTVTTEDFTNEKSVEKMLEISGVSGAAVRWEHSQDGMSHTFTMDSIRSKEESYNILVAYNGKAIGTDTKREQQVSVPKKGVFELIDLQVEYEPELRAVATFSNQIDTKQRIADFVTISPGEMKPKYVVSLNKIFIYPPSRLTGDYQIKFNEGLRSAKGKKMDKEAKRTATFLDFKPTVKFIGKGSVLPSSANMTMPFQAVNFTQVNVEVTRIYKSNILQFFQINSFDGDDELYRVGSQIVNTTIKLGEPTDAKLKQWNTYSLDLATIIKAEPGAIYRVKIRGLEPIKSETKATDDDDEDEDYYSDYYGGSYKTRNERVRNILASDIGIIAKADQYNNLNVYITNLITAQPTGGIDIKVYDFAQQLIGQGSTDADGFVQIKTKGTPQVVMANKGAEYGYLQVSSGNGLSLSDFDVSGDYVSQGVKCFIYGERGVWRPGDEIFLSVMVLDKDKSLPENHPIKLTFKNPNEQVVSTAVQTGGKSGLTVFNLKTDPDAITGVYSVTAQIGNLTFSKNLRIETVKPNRLKIDFKLNDKPVLDAANIRGDIFSQWLHGANAGALEVKVDLALSQMDTKFVGYDNYKFNNVAKYFDEEETQIFSGRLGENGVVDFTKKLDIKNESISGMLRAKFTVRVFERSGDFSIDQYTTQCSPYSQYVGMRTPVVSSGEGSEDMLETGKEHTFNVVTLLSSGKPTDVKDVQVEIMRLDWYWWWGSSQSGLANYINDNYSDPVFKTTVSTVGGRGAFKYSWDNDGWGLYLIKATDPVSGHSCAQVCYVDWWGSDRSGSGNANGAMMLKITSDKTAYNVGDKAKITIPSATGARALVTIETGSRVLSSAWYDTQAGTTTVSVDITSEMTPNIYAYVTLVQPHANTKNDAPMRMYGVIPMMVQDPQTILKPVVGVPAELRPEREFTVSVSEANNRAMTYTLAIVDDGLLDLTRFKTPSPWQSFFAREALGVKTWDLYNNVIGAYGGKIEQLFAIGGDDEVVQLGEAKAQRFLPIVKFMGPFDLKKGSTATHKVTLPPYIGSVRTMVVACSDNRAFGQAEARSQVRKPLMIKTTLPRVMGTDETVLMPVTVFAMDNTVKKVTVNLTRVDGFVVEGSKTQSVTFTKEGDQMVFFKLKAKSTTGVGRVSVEATGSDDSAKETIELDVRDPNPRSSNSFVQVIEKGATYNGDFSLAGKLGTNSCALEISSVPPLNLSQRLGYLLSYPHGCLEQTTSTVFPQLYLSGVSATDDKTNKRSESNIKAAINKYARFQTSSGSFAYWPGERYISEWANTFAGHFMTEAKRVGYSVPSDMWAKWITAEGKLARDWSSSSRSSNSEIQAYRLFVLAMAGQPETGAMNRLREYSAKSNIAKWLLAGAYGANGKADVGRGLIKELKYEPQADDMYRFSYGSDDRNKAIVVVVQHLLGNDKDVMPMVMQLSEALSSNKYMSTQTTAWSLMALSMYTSGVTQDLNFEYKVGDNIGKEKSTKPMKEIEVDVTAKTGRIPLMIKNSGESRVYMRITSHGVPTQGTEVARVDNLGMTVRYVDAQGRDFDVSNLTQGQDFTALVTIKNPGVLGNYENLVLSQVFPSGWEIRGSESVGSTIRYQDVRDDRVYSYFDLAGTRTVTIRTKLSATYAGRFYLPAVVCEAMYDGNVYASTLGQWCEVKFK